MTKRELVCSILQGWGYRPEIDHEGDVMLRYQMKSLYVLIGDEEDTYLSVMYPQFYEIEDGEDALVLATCNKVTREVKMVKVFVDHTFKNVSATCEFFYANQEALEQSLQQSLHILGLVHSSFRKAKMELTE